MKVIALPQKLLDSRANRIKCACTQIDNHGSIIISPVTTLIPASGRARSIHISGNNTVNVYCSNPDGQQQCDSRKRQILMTMTDSI